MEIGVNFPQNALGSDAVAIRDYIQAVEGLGFGHLMTGDHVLGQKPGVGPTRPGPYTADFIYHEPFLLLTYAAAHTSRLRLITGILILPQRQTALVAKQAAELDVLSAGRLTLGIGVGWNRMEYESLGERFQDRGARSEEQIEVMRALWTRPTVTFYGRWHNIVDAGINPRPVQQPIPILMGGMADAVLRRTAKMADGWIPTTRPGDSLTPDKVHNSWNRLRAYAQEAGRSSIPSLRGRLELTDYTPERWPSILEAWRQMGSTSLSIGTRAMSGTPDQHIAMLLRFVEVMD